MALVSLCGHAVLPVYFRWAFGGQSNFHWRPWGTGWCGFECVLAPIYLPGIGVHQNWTLPALAATPKALQHTYLNGISCMSFMWIVWPLVLTTSLVYYLKQWELCTIDEVPHVSQTSSLQVHVCSIMIALSTEMATVKVYSSQKFQFYTSLNEVYLSLTDFP